MQAAGATAAQEPKVHIAPRAQSKMALRACWTSAGAQATRHTHRIKRKPEGAKTTGSGGRSREQEGCTNKHKEPRRRQHERRQRTAARRLPSRSPHARRPTNHPFAVTPPVPTTHDDERSSARHLPSRPPNTQRPTDHARAISPAVPPHARRPSDHPFAFTPPAPQT